MEEVLKAVNLDGLPHCPTEEVMATLKDKYEQLVAVFVQYCKLGSECATITAATRLKLAGFDVGKHVGRVVVLYSWSVRSPGIIAAAKQWGRRAGVQLVGVNLDRDTTAARALVEKLAIPGMHFFDGGDLNGPLAQELKLTSRSSVYLVSPSGVLDDVRGYDDTESKLTRLTPVSGTTK
jgi:hypothetical protein